MSLRLGSLTPSKLQLGSSAVSKLMLGANQAWPAMGLAYPSLAPSADQPTFSYGSLPASTVKSPLIGGASTGYFREKRTGVAEAAPGVAQSSTNAPDFGGSTHYRYSGMLSAWVIVSPSNAGQYISTAFKPGSSGTVANARYLFTVEFETSAPQVSVRFNAVVANPRMGRLYVNDKLVSLTTLQMVATAGAGTEMLMTFPSAAPRRIKFVGFNNDEGRWGGVDVSTGYTVAKPTYTPGPTWVFLGDSYLQGAPSASPPGTNTLETWMWEAAAREGAQTVINLGIGGTGFVTDVGGNSNRYSTRLPDIAGLIAAGLCDVLVIEGGRNDGSSTGLQAALQELLDATTAVSTRYVATSAADTSGANAQLIAGVAANPGVRYVTPFSIDAIPKIADNVHMTYAGHQTYAAGVVAAIG